MEQDIVSYPNEVFTLTEEESAIREAAAAFAQDELLLLRTRPFRGGYIPAQRTSFWKEYFDACMARIRAAGFCGMGLPEVYGGTEVSSRAFALVMAEVSRVAPDLALSFGVDLSLFASPVVHFGMEEQKKRWLPSVARGEIHGCYCQTEAEAGSDVSRIRTRAECSTDGRWLLNGEKIFVTNGSVAGVGVVLARTSGAPGDHRGLTMFLVDLAACRKARTVEIPPNERKLGLHHSPTSTLVFRDCPTEGIVGGEGRGFAIAMTTLGASRPTLIAAQALGILWHACDLAKAYAQSRIMFGRPLAALPRVYAMLAEMDAKARMAELLTWRACLEKDAVPDGDARPYALAGSAAKLLTADYAFEAADQALQLHGGSGYVSGVEIGNVWVDARAPIIYEGTREVQEIIIAQQLIAQQCSQDTLPVPRRSSYGAVVFRMCERARFMSVEKHLSELEKALALTIRTAKRTFGVPTESATPPSFWYALARAYAVLEGAKLAVVADCRDRPDSDAPATSDVSLVVRETVRLAHEAVSRAVGVVLDEFSTGRK